ncbi:MAG: hypothetical protein E6J74_34070 [Deltaproteobacteria bacterium]|nr:MAG: hypothetical protein E6J74_34070 [Deltaproteobacteria bacterium]
MPHTVGEADAARLHDCFGDVVKPLTGSTLLRVVDFLAFCCGMLAADSVFLLQRAQHRAVTFFPALILPLAHDTVDKHSRLKVAAVVEIH